MKTKGEEMKFGGASPKILGLTIILSIPIVVINSYWKSVFEIQIAGSALMVLVSAVVLIGLPLYIYTLRTIKKGFQEGKLITTGVFSVCRNPLFAIVIFLLLPGILLYFKSWLLLFILLIFYVVFQLFIGSEEKLLEDKFGHEFKEYKTKTSRIIPMFWRYRI